jgi:hypothetical protein
MVSDGHASLSTWSAYACSKVTTEPDAALGRRVTDVMADLPLGVEERHLHSRSYHYRIRSSTSTGQWSEI